MTVPAAPTPSVLIIGHGFVGHRLAVLLTTQGYAVTVAARTKPSLAVPFAFVSADILSPASLIDLPDPDFVVFCAAPGGGDEQLYQNIYVQGPRNLLDHFDHKSLSPRWLFVSSTSVYGQNEGQWVDESALTKPQGYRGQTMLAAEKQILDASDENCVIRFSGIYGPGRDRLLRSVQSGMPVQNDPPYYTNRIHADDCAGILSFLITKGVAGEPLERIYLGSDSTPAPLSEVSNWIANQLGCSPPPTQTKCGKGANKRCRNTLILSQGYRFQYPSFQDGYSDMISRNR